MNFITSSLSVSSQWAFIAFQAKIIPMHAINEQRLFQTVLIIQEQRRAQRENPSCVSIREASPYTHYDWVWSLLLLFMTVKLLWKRAWLDYGLIPAALGQITRGRWSMMKQSVCVDIRGVPAPAEALPDMRHTHTHTHAWAETFYALISWVDYVTRSQLCSTMSLC